ncbi:hypothetical protein COO72_07815 [Bifidobacterium callitrichos]|nr:hypothetical protein COO72_07815 [Bifidobacterium callitrichos]
MIGSSVYFKKIHGIILSFVLVFSTIVGSVVFLPKKALAQEIGADQAMSQIRVQSDIPYVAPWSISQTQKLDLYSLASWGDGPDYVNSQSVSTLRPVVLFIHGGAWINGSKSIIGGAADRLPLVNTLLRAGYVVASIDYRLASESPWPAQINDCKSAVRYLRTNAERYGIDSKHIAVFGESSGAHLAMMLGVTNGTSKFVDVNDGNGNTSSDVQAVISDYGISDVDKWGQMPGDDVSIASNAKNLLLGSHYTVQSAADASPIHYVNPTVAPMLLVHGKNDTTVSYKQSAAMEEALKRVGASVTSWYPDNGPHSSYDIFCRNVIAEKLYLDFLSKEVPNKIEASRSVPVYRIFDPQSGAHMFTQNVNEMIVRAQYWSGWRNEGVAFSVLPDASSSGIPVTCLRNRVSNDYVYSTNGVEISALAASGWEKETVLNAPVDGDVPVYRLYDFRSRRHMLVTDGLEKDVLISNGWKNEGLLFYSLG